MKKSVAIITARGGSKRIPKKNIKPFLSKPIIAYSIESALESGLFDRVMVSTDDEEIIELSIKYGATVPFKRSEKNSDDFATTADVLTEVLQTLSDIGEVYSFACCIYPTAPLLTVQNLIKGNELILNSNFDTVFAACRFDFPIQRSLKVIDGGKAEMIWPENKRKRSQDFESAYRDAGQFYWLRVPNFMTKKEIFTDNTGAIQLTELEVQDIDNDVDWQLAELKYKIIHGLH